MEYNLRNRWSFRPPIPLTFNPLYKTEVFDRSLINKNEHIFKKMYQTADWISEEGFPMRVLEVNDIAGLLIANDYLVWVYENGISHFQIEHKLTQKIIVESFISFDSKKPFQDRLCEFKIDVIVNHATKRLAFVVQITPASKLELELIVENDGYDFIY